ncbi:hypothetical protein [Actinoplanes sp. NPDC051494]|uniref:hypothetical protein n=1 Tax=Actinoplanes sp. NPDC051494 TaxID=3363907 RepID=UPI0037B03904
MMAVRGALSLLLVALGMTAALTATGSNDRIDILIDKTGPMRTAGQTRDSAVVDQEAGVCGFLVLLRWGPRVVSVEENTTAEEGESGSAVHLTHDSSRRALLPSPVVEGGERADETGEIECSGAGIRQLVAMFAPVVAEVGRHEAGQPGRRHRRAATTLLRGHARRRGFRRLRTGTWWLLRLPGLRHGSP